MSAPRVISSSTENLAAHKCSRAAEEEETAEQLTADPAWFTRSYLERSLQKHHKDCKLRLGRVQARPALGKGENYGGVLTRVTAEYRTGVGAAKTGHYIVKTSYEADEFAKQTMAPYDIFNREMVIYEQVLPKLKALLAEIDDPEEIFAQTMAVDPANSALIFEDLNARGYTMPDRVAGVDMALAKIVLRKLAKMHAATAVLNERERGSLEGYDRGMYNRHTDNYAPCFLGLMEACARMLQQTEEHAQLGRKLQDLKPNFMELGKRVFDATPGHLNVLAHGDLWTNNVLVKYDEETGAPLDVIIIDFQYCAWGSPGIDLYYFLNTSLQEELHLQRQDELIQHYHKVLADTLRKLAYKARVPSLHSFHVQLEEKAFYALTSTCIVQPVQRNEDTDDADFNALMQTDERGLRFKNTVYKNAYCQRIIKQLLPVYERMGLLDLEQ